MPVYEVHYREQASGSGWWPRHRVETSPENAVEAFRSIMIELAWAMGRDVRLIERVNDGGFGHASSFAAEPLLVIPFEEAEEMVRAELDVDRPVLDDGQLQDIRQRLAFTPHGPWIEDHVNGLGKAYRTYAVPGVEWKDDATGGLQDFIAHSRMDLPLAVLEIERLREKVRRLEQALQADAGPEQGIAVPGR